METIKAFGLTPAEWRAQSVDDRARMMAHELLRGTREAYVAERIRKKATDGSKGKFAGPPGSTGVNAYEAQKAAMRQRLGIK